MNPPTACQMVRGRPPDPLPRGRLLRSVGVLAAGAALGHGITMAAMPLLSRLYTPADFGVLAVFGGVVSTVAVAACLRFDVAVMLPDDDDESFSLLLLSIGCAAAVSAIVAAVALTAPTWLAERLGQPQLAPYLWLLPISIFAAAAFSALQGWHTRARTFGLLAWTRIGQSAAAAVTQIGAGLAALTPIGLLVGYVMNGITASVVLGGALVGRRCSRVGMKKRADLLRLMRAYGRFPRFSTWEALANSASIQVPIVMIAAAVASSEAGFIALAMYAIQAPMALFGIAIGQVYVSHAPEAYREGRLGGFTVEVFGKLAIAGLGPLLAIGIVAPYLFELVFGAGWGRAGWLVAWMTPWFMLQFLASPISMALHVTEHQKAAMLIQIFGLVLRIGVIALAARLVPAAVGEAYAVSGAVVYGVYLALVLVVVQAPGRAVIARFMRAALVAVPWAIVGMVGVWLAELYGDGLR